MKTDHIANAVLACCLLHNYLMEGKDVDLEFLFEVIKAEARENQDPSNGKLETWNSGLETRSCPSLLVLYTF